MQLDNQVIRIRILQILERVRALDPTRYALSGFDTQGFCNVLGIRHSDYMSNAVYLREKGYVADSRIEQLTIENGGIHITAAGIDYLENQQSIKERAMNTKADEEGSQHSPTTANTGERLRIIRILHIVRWDC